MANNSIFEKAGKDFQILFSKIKIVKDHLFGGCISEVHVQKSPLLQTLKEERNLQPPCTESFPLTVEARVVYLEDGAYSMNMELEDPFHLQGYANKSYEVGFTQVTIKAGYFITKTAHKQFECEEDALLTCVIGANLNIYRLQVNEVAVYTRRTRGILRVIKRRAANDKLKLVKVAQTDVWDRSFYEDFYEEAIEKNFTIVQYRSCPSAIKVMCNTVTGQYNSGGDPMLRRNSL